MTNAEVLHQVEHGFRMPPPPGCPQSLYEIMLDCWQKNETKRPSFETLQWRLEEFFTIPCSEYAEFGAASSRSWCEVYSAMATKSRCIFQLHVLVVCLISVSFPVWGFVGYLLRWCFYFLSFSTISFFSASCCVSSVRFVASRKRLHNFLLWFFSG